MDRLPIRIEPRAGDEMQHEQRWYARRSPVTADALSQEILDGIERVRDDPVRYPLAKHGTRRYLLKRFPLSIIYQLRPDCIHIIAFAHAKRRVAYWKKRLDP